MQQAQRLPNGNIQLIRQKRELTKMYHRKPADHIKYEVNKLQIEIKQNKWYLERTTKNTEFISTSIENNHINSKSFWKIVSTKRKKRSGTVLTCKLDFIPITSHTDITKIFHEIYKDKATEDTRTLTEKLQK